MFAGTQIQEFKTPKTVREISQAAFHNCRKLKRIILNEGLEAGGTDEYAKDDSKYFGTFYGSGLEEVILPSTIKRIEYSAFEKCRNLR